MFKGTVHPTWKICHHLHTLISFHTFFLSVSLHSVCYFRDNVLWDRIQNRLSGRTWLINRSVQYNTRGTKEEEIKEWMNPVSHCWQGASVLSYISLNVTGSSSSLSVILGCWIIVYGKPFGRITGQNCSYKNQNIKQKICIYIVKIHILTVHVYPGKFAYFLYSAFTLSY